MASSKKGRINKRQNDDKTEAAKCPPAPEEESNSGAKGEVAPLKSGKRREAKTNATTDATAPKLSKGGKRRRSGSSKVDTGTFAEESLLPIAAKVEARAAVSPTTRNLKEGMCYTVYIDTTTLVIQYSLCPPYCSSLAQHTAPPSITVCQAMSTNAYSA